MDKSDLFQEHIQGVCVDTAQGQRRLGGELKVDF